MLQPKIDWKLVAFASAMLLLMTVVTLPFSMPDLFRMLVPKGIQF